MFMCLCLNIKRLKAKLFQHQLERQTLDLVASRTSAASTTSASAASTFTLLNLFLNIPNRPKVVFFSLQVRNRFLGGVVLSGWLIYNWNFVFLLLIVLPAGPGPAPARPGPGLAAVEPQFASNLGPKSDKVYLVDDWLWETPCEAFSPLKGLTGD